MSGTTIIVADDEPLVLNFAGGTLEKADFQVVKAKDGFEALAICEWARARSPSLDRTSMCFNV
jgi:CheY-like chemotaxis protein